MKDTTGTTMVCAHCGKKLGRMTYWVNDKVYCPDCHCALFGVCA